MVAMGQMETTATKTGESHHLHTLFSVVFSYEAI